MELSRAVELVNKTLWSGATQRQAHGHTTHPYRAVKPLQGVASFGGELGRGVELVS